MQQTLIGLFVVFVVLGLFFTAVQKVFPALPDQKIFRRGFLTDCAYWLVTPIMTRIITPIAIFLVLLPVALIWQMTPQEFVNGHGPLAQQSVALQAVQILLLGDFLGYWQHRWFHGGWRWPFHAVHHSSLDLDWLSSVRVHPVNDALARIIQAVPIVALGYDARVAALYAPVTTLYALFLHANVPFGYGPLRYAIASPAFHRWHHTSAHEGRDKNFAGLFPVFDLVFGTFYMPKGRQPTEFGVSDPVPRGLVGQLFWPFRRGRSMAD